MRDHLRAMLCALLLTSLLFTGGCTPAITGIIYESSDHGPTTSQRALLEEELAPYRERGESAITGRVFLETPEGKVVGVERPVHLTPATGYSRALVQAKVVGKDEMIDRRAEDVWWSTQADRDGRFVFSWLPAGEYFVLSEVAWSPDGGTDAKVAVAYALVRVDDRQHIDVEVTRRVGF